MNIAAYAARKQIAIEEIARKLKIDLSLGSLPKAREPKYQELFRLEKIAEEAGSNCDCEAELIARISEIEGIGPATVNRIREGLAQSRLDSVESL